MHKTLIPTTKLRVGETRTLPKTRQHGCNPESLNWKSDI